MDLSNIIGKTTEFISGFSPLLTKAEALLYSRSIDGSTLPKAITVLGSTATALAFVKTGQEVWESHVKSYGPERSVSFSEDTLAYDIIMDSLNNFDDPEKHDGEDLSLSNLKDTRLNNVRNLVADQIPIGDGKVIIHLEDKDAFSDRGEMFGIKFKAKYSPKTYKDWDRIGSKNREIPGNLTCTFKSYKDRNNFVDALGERIYEIGKRTPSLYRTDSNGYLRKARNLHARDLDSVFLREGQMERLIDGINLFKKNGELYENLGIPKHTGIVLHGPPGTGKSSTITALANHFSSDVVFISLSSLQGDDALNMAVSDLVDEEEIIVVFEDVDSVTSTLSREGRIEESNKNSVTMSGLLNVLDGQMSPENCIFILTTNYIDRIDPAIIRAGRVEYTEYLDYIDNYQFENFYRFVFKKDPVGFNHVTPDMKITPADMASVVRKSINNLDKAEDDLRDIINSHPKTNGEVNE